ncbi:MAG: AAA family ATPase [Planctomycetes bacterium]|nr:AAA family ATPase [Planctomycetota bacterium]
MLSRFYVHNYKCFLNFEFSPVRSQLLIGRNGTGKSSVLEVLALLRLFLVDGIALVHLFPTRTLNFTQRIRTQRFELDVQCPEGLLTYVLEVDHEPDTGRSRVAREELLAGDAPLFQFIRGHVTLYHDNQQKGPEFDLDWTRSGLFHVTPGPSNKRLTWFKEWIAKIQRVQLNPFAMGSQAEREESTLYWNGSNFANWYRHQSQEDQRSLAQLFRNLSEVIDGFESFALVPAGENVRILRSVFPVSDGGASPAIDQFVGFEQLSEGQKCLSVLYAVLIFSARKGALLCFDEPNNFVALREVQPFLMELEKRSDKEECQVLVSSHHPELINYFASRDIFLLSREGVAPTTARRMAFDPATGVSPAEMIARGWENG